MPDLIPITQHQIASETKEVALIALALETIVKKSYCKSTHDAAMEDFHNLRVPHDMLYLKDAVLTHLFWGSDCLYRKTEFMLHDKFKRELGILIPGARFIPFPLGHGKRPDFMIKIGKDILPVEIKLREFNRSSLRQLNGYLSEFGCKKGIAVAEKCTCSLPNNIQFIGLSL